MSKKNTKNRQYKKIQSRKKVFESIAKELAAKSKRWETFFELTKRKGVRSFKIIEYLFNLDAGSNLNQTTFPYARTAKVVATTEEWNVDQKLVTKKDLVNWNRQAILAMIEAVKKEDNNLEKIERGYEAIEILNVLFPEYKIESPKTSPFPKW